MQTTPIETIGTAVWMLLWDGSLREYAVVRVTPKRILKSDAVAGEVRLDRDVTVQVNVYRQSALAGGCTIYFVRAEGDAEAAALLEQKAEQRRFAERAREKEDQLRAQGLGGWQN